MKGNSFFIYTFGCQMNIAESNEMANLLIRNGFNKADDVGYSDIVIFNTCSVREHAANRIKSYIEKIERIKKDRDVLFVLTGCLSVELGREFFDLHDSIDVMLGVDNRDRIADIIKEALKEKKRIFKENSKYNFPQSVPDGRYPFKAFINITHGCDNFCSYCIVPYLRGRQISRSSKDIIKNVKELASSGVVEVMLLGQNVNTYGVDNGDISFGELLKEVANIDGIKRIRFLTSHPKDFDIKLIDTILSLDNVCKEFHLPLQSGADKILKLMNRRYDVKHYLNIIDYIKKNSPDSVITTDIIVGFPGESERDFEDTLDIVKSVEFDDAYMYKYSKRSFTKASTLPWQIDEEVKIDRLQRLIKLQTEISKAKNNKYIGMELEVLIEDLSSKSKKDAFGLSKNGKPVVVKDIGDNYIGKFINVKIKENTAKTLIGSLI